MSFSESEGKIDGNTAGNRTVLVGNAQTMDNSTMHVNSLAELPA